MGVGRGLQVGLGPHLDFENFSKIGRFLSFDWEKRISSLLASHGKSLEKSPSALPPGKNPSDAHGKKYKCFTQSQLLPRANAQDTQ